MRPVQPHLHIVPFPTQQPPTAQPGYTTRPYPPMVGPLRRIELHQVEHDEIRALRDRLLQLILDNERDRKVARFRLVN